MTNEELISELEQRKNELVKLKEQALANANAFQGALMEADRVLTLLRQPEVPPPAPPPPGNE